MKKIVVIIFLLSWGFLFSCAVSKSSSVSGKNLSPEARMDRVEEEYGKALYARKCAACHGFVMGKDLTGPALGGVTKRRKQKWLYAYTRNSARMRADGDEEALRLKEVWILANMISFEDLTDQELEAIYNFVEELYALEVN